MTGLPYTGVNGADQALVDAIAQAWGYVLPGATIQGTSGARPGGRPSSQHYTGNAWDFGVTRADGNPVMWNDPEVAIAAEVFAALTGQNVGVGWGPSYMGGRYFHFDDGGNPHAPRGRVMYWSDDDGGASDRGPGAAQYGEILAAARGLGLEGVLARHNLSGGTNRPFPNIAANPISGYSAGAGPGITRQPNPAYDPNRPISVFNQPDAPAAPTQEPQTIWDQLAGIAANSPVFAMPAAPAAPPLAPRPQVQLLQASDRNPVGEYLNFFNNMAV